MPANEQKGLKKLTFTHMRKGVKVSVKNQMVSPKIHQKRFGQISIIMQNQNFYLKELFHINRDHYLGFCQVSLLH